MTKKAIKNSFIFVLILVQLINMHKKINKVVKIIKKSEMPSIPKLKFKFKKGIHNNLLTNWKEPTDLLKKTHKNIKGRQFKCMYFILYEQDIFKLIQEGYGYIFSKI